MSTKKRRCDTRSPSPFETPPPIAREEHEQNWHTCCTFDLDTLECNICMDYLRAPIYQCENGHAACSRCCFKLMPLRICPTCQLMTGVICNLQLEKLIETLHVACKYAEFGCKKWPRLMAKTAHEISCGYKSFKCPASVGCISMCSVSGISHHFQVKHAVKMVEVPSNEWVEILLELTVDSADLLLKTEDMLFLFHHEKQLYGSVIYILSFAEVSQENAYRYHVEVHLDERVFSMTTIAKSVRQPGKDQVASSLIIPNALLAGKLGIPICYHLYCAKEEEEEEYPISAKESDTTFSPIEDPIDSF